MSDFKTLKPLGKKLVAVRIAKDEKTPGGLFIPEMSKEKSTYAKVLAVGAGVSESANIKVGDTILFGKHAGNEILIADKACMVFHEDEVIGVVE